MIDPRKPIFDAVRDAAPSGLFAEAGNILALDNLLDAFKVPRAEVKTDATGLTPRIVMEILEHEAIVPEAYRDSVGVWTWGVGVTNASGHEVHPRYKDNPQSIARCLEIYVWLLREKYLPGVLAAFKGHPLTENELGAALSFHYNTGAIRKADWVTSVRTGKRDQARQEFMNWSSPKEIIPRRKAERNLFFDGAWTSDGKVTAYDVAKPSYSPKWSSARQIDVRADLAALLA